MANRCRNKIPRDGETGVTPSDRLIKAEIVLQFPYHPRTYQLSFEADSPETKCFRSSSKMDNRTEPVRYRVHTLASNKEQALANFIVEFTTPAEK